MKIFILFLLLLISPIELRRRNDDIYELDDLLNNQYDRRKHHSNKQYNLDQIDNNDDQYYPSSFQHEKKYPSRKKVLNINDYINEESENDDIKTTTTTDQNDLFDTSLCINKYDIKSEKLIKIKELKNDAHMIRYTIIDKRTLSSDLSIKDICMLNCCSEKTCDLSMLSEQPTHEGYKCYLFACNGSCTLASHQDYTIMIPKKDLIYYTETTIINIDVKSTSTISNVNLPYEKSFFRETSVILFLLFGIICTIILFILLYFYCGDLRKRGRRLKNYTVDADYLINGLYL